MDKPFAYLLILYRTMLPHVLFLPHYGVVTTTRFESTADMLFQGWQSPREWRTISSL